MSSERVKIDVDGDIACVRLARPAKRNALDLAMFEAIAGAIDTLAERRDLRAVVLSGEGQAFCAGIDLADLGRISAIDLLPRTHGPANLFQHCAFGWRRLPVPVIAAIRGQAFGGGLQVALGADIRILSPDAQLSVMEARWGLVPDMAGMALLPGLVRTDMIRDLTYSARILGAAEAVELGLATRIADDPEREALRQARAIAAQSPDAIRAAKRLMAMPLETVERILIAESIEQQALLRSQWHRDLLAGRSDATGS